MDSWVMLWSLINYTSIAFDARDYDCWNQLFLSFLRFFRLDLSPFFPLILVHWYVIRSETPKTLMWDYLSILFQLAKIVISSALNGLSTVVGNWMCRIQHICRIHCKVETCKVEVHLVTSQTMIGVYCPWSKPSWCNPAILAKVSLGRNRNCIANFF
jgi:hypothetical protein